MKELYPAPLRRDDETNGLSQNSSRASNHRSDSVLLLNFYIVISCPIYNMGGKSSHAITGNFFLRCLPIDSVRILDCSVFETLWHQIMETLP